MTSDSDRPESPSFDERRSSNDECTRPNDIAGPHYQSTCTLQSLERLKELCRIPPGIMAEAKIADPTESPENHRDGYFCVYEIYFKGCGLTFPLPEALVRYLAALEIALPQLTPNLLRTILGIITVAAEADYIIGVPELNELLSVRTLLASTLPTEEFIKFFKIILEGETLWNSFTLDRFIEANRKLRMSPPNQLHRLPPPPLTQGMSARAFAAQRKKLSKPIAEACDENKAFLAAAIDKKDYSRTLLIDDGSTEGARSVAVYRLTPRRERRDQHSPRRERSPRRDSPRPPRDDFSNEPLKNLVRKKRDKSSRSDSSPRREKSRARTDRSPRSSPPSEPMGPPRSVDMSSSSRSDGEKTARNASPKKGDSESRDASSRSKPVLVPQVKSLSAMEKEGSVFRCFKTRSGSILPDFNKWRPEIRERYLLHAHHSSRAIGELNDMVEHYEGLVLGREEEIEVWKKKLSALEAELSSFSGSKQDQEDKIDNLTSELATLRGALQDQYDLNFKLQEEFSGVQGRLQESESNADSLNNQLIELNAKYKAIAKLRESELARSASKARKEVKGRGMELIQGAIRFMQTEKARSVLESDIKEHESNLILLDQIHETDFSEVQERSDLSASLSEKRSRLAALPTSTFNPQDFEEFFTESPPLSESGLDWAGSSGTEDVNPPEVPVAPEFAPEDGRTVESGLGTSSDQAPVKEASETPTAEPGSEVADKHRRLCEERQRLGLKRQTLEARIARVERKIRALESDPFQWEWRNFDSVAEIPKMLRMYLRAKGVPGPASAPIHTVPSDSEEEDLEEEASNCRKRLRDRMEFNLRCSESMPDFSRIGMINEDVANEPSRRPPPSRGSFRSQIRAPCALIRDLPIRDQGTAAAFIEALALQHRKLALEKKRLRRRINRMQRRLTTVSRDLHILESHPGEWIELGISDFVRIPDCMMPVLDLAGQGVEVFCSSTRFP
ncbi:hypothetical protein ISN45_Aa07g028150 [Arabidopsis thaliana x Arabidopsis arenosa]|uniref:Myosin heavy chain-like protein n=1 Tax=Arabidopsis thaliana x Arabidopsis arenosa TaxID=1240361 RepID=A0A8T1Y867_9BRAS|nr:hypothetical protein ISN45_Aa07g028150 [Arabidopsis thaliana x Arabidopsis arenosa]